MRVTRLNLIALVGIILILLVTIRGLSHIASSIAFASISTHIMHTLREEMFGRLITLPTSYFQNHTSGNIASHFVYTVSQISNAGVQVLNVLVKDTLRNTSDDVEVLERSAIRCGTPDPPQPNLCLTATRRRSPIGLLQGSRRWVGSAGSRPKSFPTGERPGLATRPSGASRSGRAPGIGGLRRRGRLGVLR